MCHKKEQKQNQTTVNRSADIISSILTTFTTVVWKAKHQHPLEDFL